MEESPGAGATPYDLTPAAPPEGGAGAADARRFPWPPAPDQPALEALAETWRRSMFEPSRFYRALAPDAPLGPALVYYLVVGVLASGISLFWSAVFTAAGITEGPLARLVGTGGDWTWNVVGFLLSPLWLVVALWILAAIVHVTLVILGGARNGFGGSLRAFAYAISPNLLLVVPALGTVLGFGWWLVLAVVGLREVHGTSTGRALAAILLPGLLFFGLLFVVVLMALFAVAL